MLLRALDAANAAAAVERLREREAADREIAEAAQARDDALRRFRESA